MHRFSTTLKMLLRVPRDQASFSMFTFPYNQYILFGRSGRTELNPTEATETELVDDRDDCVG